MKLRIPFINRHRYIVLKSYTFNKFVHENSPLVMSKNIKKESFCPSKSIGDRFSNGFNTCYGYIKSLDVSITIPAWTEFRIKSDNNNFGYMFPGSSLSQADSVNDPEYTPPKDQFMSKLLVPWMLEANRNVKFVMAKHPLNMTNMNTITGVVSFYNGMHSPHIFNGIPKNSDFIVPFSTPLVSLFPLSELPIYLKTEYNKDMFNTLFEAQSLGRNYIKGACLKNDRLNKKKELL